MTNKALKALMVALKEENESTKITLSTKIEDLEGEFVVFRAAMGKGVLDAPPSLRLMSLN